MLPPTAVMSAAVKFTGASVKVKVTTEALSPSFRLASTMFTTTVGLTVSIGTLSAPPVPLLPAAFCQALPTVTEPVPA